MIICTNCCKMESKHASLEQHISYDSQCYDANRGLEKTSRDFLNGDNSYHDYY